MRRALVTSLGLLAFAAGCERSPEDPIFAYGRVLQRDGTPRAGASLSLERMEDDERFHPVGITTTTEASGDYTLEMLSGDAVFEDSYSRTRQRLRVALPLEEDGSGTFMRFYMQDDVELPTLQPWDAHPLVGTGDQGPTVSFPPAPPAPTQPETAETLELLTEDGELIPMLATDPVPLLWVTSGAELLWRQSGASSPWTPGPYVLEDFAAPQVRLRAASVGEWIFAPLGAGSSSVGFRMEWRTGAEPLPAGTLRPVSRGATCEPSFPDVCPWTDGRLTRVDFFKEETDPRAFGVVIHLPRPVIPRRAVVRGLNYLKGWGGRDWLVLEGSEDAEHWQSLARVKLRDLTSQERTLRETVFNDSSEPPGGDSPYGDGPLPQGSREPVFQDVPLSSTAPVRFVRLSVESLTYDGTTPPAEFYTLSELSIFE
ncbi:MULTISPECIES: hypothetical protein [unclassified Corallococcus]|uniref:hypothetical protein n=1 Tax=unclassified Corallococcus TaxID=2685029 RepID=UPI001A8EF90E|nr:MULTISPECIES: hypothetical protein [unclassified Corallococcus]MBN9681161.1 hypothetical protein [Corallococcus sp. NCSPR001]WAS87258.1 hypothetical protein O0N60_09820 [Corallococcus sp. NCRR]